MNYVHHGPVPVIDQKFHDQVQRWRPTNQTGLTPVAAKSHVCKPQTFKVPAVTHG